MKTKSLYWLVGLALLPLLAACDSDIWAFKDENKGAYVASDCSPIASTLEEMEQYQEWVKVLNYSETFQVLNAAFGAMSSNTFTHFAPTNEAMQSFYAEKGVSGIEDLGVDYAKAMVRNLTYVADSLKLTEQFGPDVVNIYLTTRNGDELCLCVDEETGDGGFLLSFLQEKAHVQRNYITCTNGFIYEIESAISPLVETVYDRLVNEGDCSIFLNALRETGYDKDLQVVYDTTYVLGAKKITARAYTLLAVKDADFAKTGIQSVADLKQVLVAHAENAEVVADSLLKQYVEYHLFEDKFTMAKLGETAGSDSIRVRNPKSPYQILLVTKHDYVYPSADTLAHAYCYSVNDDDASYEKPAFAESPLYADNLTFLFEGKEPVAKNGQLHFASNWLPVYEPKPTRVVWDLADYAEVRAYAASLNRAYQPEAVLTNEEYFSVANLDCYKAEVGPSGSGSGNGYPSAVTYVACKSNLKNCFHHDRIVINVGYMGSLSVTSPTLAKGKYRVTLSIAYTTNHSDMKKMNNCKGGLMRVLVDLPSNDYVPTADEAAQYHQLDCTPYTTITSSQPNVYSAVLYDEIEFTETASHTFKFVVLDPAATTSSKFSLDFDTIVFTPIEEE
ncbi:MAG: DUF5108 domain-containing protein [Bacteroidales bacterium]|nr:DUF5108 domain-containing protein [Bacteroidales bacterium]